MEQWSQLYSVHNPRYQGCCWYCPVSSAQVIRLKILWKILIWFRSYVCPTCEATGDRAHTQRYCPRFDKYFFLKCVNIVLQGKRRETEVFWGERGGETQIHFLNAMFVSFKLSLDYDACAPPFKKKFKPCDVQGASIQNMISQLPTPMEGHLINMRNNLRKERELELERWYFDQFLKIGCRTSSSVKSTRCIDY